VRKDPVVKISNGQSSNILNLNQGEISHLPDIFVQKVKIKDKFISPMCAFMLASMGMMAPSGQLRCVQRLGGFFNAFTNLVFGAFIGYCVIFWKRPYILHGRTGQV